MLDKEYVEIDVNKDVANRRLFYLSMVFGIGVVISVSVNLAQYLLPQSKAINVLENLPKEMQAEIKREPLKAEDIREFTGKYIGNYRIYKYENFEQKFEKVLELMEPVLANNARDAFKKGDVFKKIYDSKVNQRAIILDVEIKGERNPYQIDYYLLDIITVEGQQDEFRRLKWLPVDLEKGPFITGFRIVSPMDKTRLERDLNDVEINNLLKKGAVEIYNGKYYAPSEREKKQGE
jgi:hypothetical protein